MGNYVLLFFFSLFLEGVFGDTEVVSVKIGDSVTLHTDSKIQKGDGIYWRVQPQNIIIATIDKEADVLEISDDELYGKFKSRLKLDNKTGDLTITNIMTTDIGGYEVSNDGGVKKSFNVSVVSVDSTKTASVLEGDLITLLPDVPDIKAYNAIQWRFEHQKSPVAEIKAGSVPKYNETDKRFKGKLQLDPQTGSLTIKNIRTEQAGVYYVDVIRSGHTAHKSYNVTIIDVTWSEILKKEGDSVLLHTGAKIQGNDLILWKFGDVVLAEIYRAEKRFATYDGPDERFKNRLKLDEQTGDLTIMEIDTTDSGFYELMIKSNISTIHKKFTVSVSVDGVSLKVVVWIAVPLLLLLVVAVAMVFHYRRKNADLQKVLDRVDVLMPNTNSAKHE